MYILGFSGFYHDSAACLVCNGEIVAASQEERFSRIKHDSNFPINSILFCLNKVGIDIEDVDHVVFYDKPFLKFDRLFESYLAFAPKGFKSFVKSLPSWTKDKLFQKSNIIKSFKDHFPNSKDITNKLLFSEHHFSHAASAFYPSPFNNAAILTMDGVGEWTTTSLAIGNQHKIDIIKEIHYPHSLGLLYSAFTYYTGFKVNSGEYKLMGLAPYGKPIYKDLILNNLIDVKEDGSFILNMKYFSYCTDLVMTSPFFDDLFGGQRRSEESKITQREMDLASSIQSVLEYVVIKLARDIAKSTNEQNLCLAGGVALNCVANGKLVREKLFKNIWIQPASGDAGGSIGSALGVYYQMLSNPRKINSTKDFMKGAYLGSEYNQDSINKLLKKKDAIFTVYEEKEMLKETAKLLSLGNSIGWFNGRAEFGPRSLGSRSIIADPRSETMQKKLNLKIKYRESFRPFAPAILREDLKDWFDLDQDSPYMLLVSEVNKEKQKEMTASDLLLFGIDKLNINRSEIPAVTHVDYSARVQTVHKETNLLFYNLISEFKEITGCPIVINTSFNIRGEPIVNTPEDAFRCFMGTDLDILVVGNAILSKKEQKNTKIINYKQRYKLD